MSFTEDGIFIDDDVRMVTVVDRVGPGGDLKLKSGQVLPGTLYWDHKPHTIKPKFQLRAPAAKHFFRYGSIAWLHDADGTYVNRLGIESGDETLIAEIGDFTDCTPIDVDLEAVEHWDTAASGGRAGKTTKVKRIKAPSMAELRAQEG